MAAACAAAPVLWPQSRQLDQRDGWTLSLEGKELFNQGQTLMLMGPDSAYWTCKLTPEALAQAKQGAGYYPFVSARMDGDWNGDGRPEVLAEVRTSPRVSPDTGEPLPTDEMRRSVFLLSVIDSRLVSLAEVSHVGTASGYPFVREYSVQPRASGWAPVILWEMDSGTEGISWRASCLEWGGGRYAAAREWKARAGAGRVRLVDDRVNIRKDADLRSRSLGLAGKGTVLVPLAIAPEIVEIDGCRAPWMEVLVSGGPLDGTTGWVYAAYVSPW